MAVGSWPKAFDAKQMAVTGGTQYVRVGGKGRSLPPSDAGREERCEHERISDLERRRAS